MWESKKQVIVVAVIAVIAVIVVIAVSLPRSIHTVECTSAMLPGSTLHSYSSISSSSRSRDVEDGKRT